MNEWIFFAHVAAVIFFSLTALRMGKEALVALIALQAVLANLFVMKQMKLVGLDVTCSDVYVVGSMLCFNLLQEFYGKQYAKPALAITFASMLFFGLVSQTHLSYIPSCHDTTHAAYSNILEMAPRITLASFASYLLSQLVNTTLFRALGGFSLMTRTTLALLGGQLADTVSFDLLGLYGEVAAVFHIMLVGYVVKVLSILSMTPVTTLAYRFAAPAMR